MVAGICFHRLSAYIALIYIHDISHTSIWMFCRTLIKAAIRTVRIFLLFLVFFLVFQPSLINVLVTVSATINRTSSIRSQVMFMLSRFRCITGSPPVAGT